MESKIVQSSSKSEKALFGNGCFWCTEAIFKELQGVISVTSGYSGGTMINPDYTSVCTGNTGHAECLEIIYNSDIISYEALLEVFWKTHDPTSLNKQGEDEGTQYRSVIFYYDDIQYKIAREYIQQINESGVYQSPIVTTLEPFETFYPAEDYHQDYFASNGQNPYCHFVVKPKVEKFKKEFVKKIK